MFTKEQIELFIRYDGDIDAFCRVAQSKKEKIMDDNVFLEIELLVQDIIRMKNGVLAETYLERLKTDLEKNKIDDSLIEKLYNKFKGK